MQFDVLGMSCAACSARVEGAVSKLQGVKLCSVNLLTNSMEVEGDISPEEIIAAVSAAGYSATLRGAATPEKTKKPKTDIAFRLISSLIILVPLMYLSMGHMAGLPLPEFIGSNILLQGILQMVLALAVMVLNRKFFINGIKGVIKGAPNMDTLVAMGSLAAFGYSIYALFAGQDIHGLYFESAAMILALITVGKALEERSKGKTTDALDSLINLAPKSATVLREGKELLVDVSDLRVGDIFILRPGESIPADAVVIEGESSVNESALTGESIPVDKTVGDRISAATINISGFLKCRAEKVGEETALSKIIKMVSDAAASKAPIAKLADKVSGVFVPVVIGIAAVTVAAWLLSGAEVGFAVARGISVLVISCPCALGLATPVAIMVGSGVGAKNGILFKTAEALENAGKSDIIIVDKTGTVTEGQPSVTDIIPLFDTSEKALLECAYSLEKMSEHPLAAAVCRKAEEEGAEPFAISDFKAVFGKGVRGNRDGRHLFGGNYNFIKENSSATDDLDVTLDRLASEGKTPLIFADEEKVLGIIAVADTVREDSKDAIKNLQRMNLRVVMVTGDNEKTAAAVADSVGIREVVAGVLPEGKAKVVAEFRKNGRVAFVGDGINDAPALTSADTGIAIGAGTDVAIDAADVVLMQSRLSDVVSAIRLSRATLRNIKENLFWAFVYNIIGIPLAAGLFIPVFGWELSPMFGAAAMSLSSFCVVTNALRLNFTKLQKSKTESKPAIQAENTEKTDKENDSMREIIETYKLNVSGMMCEHCAARVKEAILKLEEVDSCEVDLASGEVTINLWVPMPIVIAAKTIESLGYKVL